MQVKELAADKFVRVTFAGSFQCRLATSPAPQGASPNEPDRRDQTGWTLAYFEKSFERVIHLSNPVQLRSALVDPWEDARVTKVEASASALGQVGGYWGPMVDLVGDPLLGQGVSLGEAKFNSGGGGGGIGYEILDDFAFSIGGTLLTAEQAQKTRLTGINELGKEVRDRYQRKKMLELTPGTLSMMHPARRARLSEYHESEKGKPGALPRHVQNYASFYSMESDMPDIPLAQVRLNASNGVLAGARAVADRLAWKLSLNFSRFDGDTLVGRVTGVLEGCDSKVDRGKQGTRA